MLRARVLGLPLTAVVVLALTGCGGSSDDTTSSASGAAETTATSAACRGLAVVDGSLTGVEAGLRDGTFQNADAAYFTSAITRIGELVAMPDVSNDLLGPTTRLAAAYGTSGHGASDGIQQSVQVRNVAADNTAWALVAAACKPYLD